MRRHLDLRDLSLLNLLINRLGNLPPGVHRGLMGSRMLDILGEFCSDQARGDFQEELAVLQGDLFHRIEHLDNLGVILQAQGAEEDRSQELSFSVDTDVKDVLGVILEFNPGATVGNSLSEEIGAHRW